MSEGQTVGQAVEQATASVRMLDESRWADVLPAHIGTAQARPIVGHTPDSDCGGDRGTAPSPRLFLRAGLGFPPYSERQSNNPPQGFHSSTGTVDNPRPPMSRLTAQTLRKAHSQVSVLHRLGREIPQGLVLLERDYQSWRRRVRWGRQRETLLAVPWSAEVRQP